MSEKTKRQKGRPQKKIDWELVKKLAGIMCTQEEIASFLDVCVDTLCTASLRDLNCTFSEFINANNNQGKVSLRRAQFETALNGNVTMQIWLGKQILGQRDFKYDDKDTAEDGLKKLSEVIKQSIDLLDNADNKNNEYNENSANNEYNTNNT